MQWQTKLPLIAILRGITPDDTLVLQSCRVMHRSG
ncbi:hypothetical protein L447_07132 [Escherichia coli BIDMC 17B]|nr:hypothetical protein L447_07132 [Escherichia coli BIDMC 17B]